MKKKLIVISAVNLIEGGTLTILKECLSYLSLFLSTNPEYEVITLVYDKSLCFYPNIKFIEIKKPKQSWIYRLQFEYQGVYKISKQLKAYLWLSLHDISPKVTARRQVVYCHNPTPFYPTRLKDIYYNYKVFLFSLFYKHLYRINIKKNDYVIVQQDWLRDAFSKLYGLKKESIIVAYPNKSNVIPNKDANLIINSTNPIYTFLYPSFARPFKNFEIICEAVNYLNEDKTLNFKVVLTLDGSENNYSKHILKSFNHIQNIDFIGIKPHEEIITLYEKANCLIFPSNLETWGLPISEFSKYNKPMLIADLPYAHETASSANKVCFFDPSKPKELASYMLKLIKNDFSILHKVPKKPINKPFVNNWEELFKILLK